MDHRSHATRGLIWAPSFHLGPSAAHLLRQNKPAPRVRRYLALQEKEKALDEQRQSIKRTRRNILVLEQQEQSDRHARLVWHDEETRFMQALLSLQPTSGDIANADEALNIQVAERSGPGAQASHAVGEAAVPSTVIFKRLAAAHKRKAN